MDPKLEPRPCSLASGFPFITCRDLRFSLCESFITHTMTGRQHGGGGETLHDGETEVLVHKDSACGENCYLNNSRDQEPINFFLQ